MRILLTNDDGYDAPGLRALYLAVRDWPGVSIEVIAPSEVQSSKGHTVSDRFRCWRTAVAEMGDVLVVEGTPADCVRAAVALPGMQRPDWVISGINRSSNLGVDIYNSGTVAAAREAGFLGIPAMAVSYLVKAALPDDWERVTREAAGVIAALLQPDAACPPQGDLEVHRQTVAALGRHPAMTESGRLHQWWNINFPRLPADEAVRGVQITTISRDPLALEYRVGCDPDGVQFCENRASYYDRPAAPGTDVAATFSGWISLSPLRWCEYR
ncbi:MAG: 5'/3'-nucleotidase SurE [Phycisphaerae bacterium]